MSYFSHAPGSYGPTTAVSAPPAPPPLPPPLPPPPPGAPTTTAAPHHPHHHPHHHPQLSHKGQPTGQQQQEALPFFCSEVYFSAWYNAHMNGGSKDHAKNRALPHLKGLPSTLDDLPTMLSKGHVIDGRKSSGGPPVPPGVGGLGGPLSAKKHHPKLPPGLQAAHLEMANSLSSSPAKSMPIHCIVEQVVVGGGGEKGSATTPTTTTTEVDMDTYAILPSSTLFNEIIRVAMTKLGYSVVEAMGAKGAIQIRNWKPLTFDTITDFPDATVEEILGDLTSIATLRIRLCSRSKLNALEDVKEKLLHFLVQHSQGMLQSVGCPIEKGTLSRICKGDYPLNLPDDTRQAFERWYKDQTMKREPLSEPRPAKEARYDPGGGGGGGQHHLTAHGLPSSYPTLRSELNLSMTSGYVPKTRIRTSFDPEHEIPRLHRWFTQNQHPSREQMVVFLNELNSLESRRGRKPLDLTNIIYWFKNARAAQRRANRSSDMLSEDQNLDVEQDLSMDDHDPSEGPETDRLSPVSSESVPVLPNKNAVYVVSSPLHHHPQTARASSRSSSPVIHIIPQDPTDLVIDSGPDNPTNGSTDRTDSALPVPPSSATPVSSSGGDARPASTASSTAGLNNNGKGGETLVVVENGIHSGHSDSEMDEPMEEDGEGQAHNGHDYSTTTSNHHHHHHHPHHHHPHHRRRRSTSADSRSSHSDEKRHDPLDSSGSGHSTGSHSSGELDPGRDHHRLDIKQEMEHNRDAEYHSSSAATTPSPQQQQHMLALSAAPQPPPAHQSHAMAAMAALPHPINFHYMHSAAAAHALYGGLDSSSLSHLTSPHHSHSPYKDSPPMSAEERKKRSRVFIDPLTEIPKLEKWFAEDTHPSSYMIEKYTEELNRSDYRQRFPKLEPKNVQLWFKNHRAKVKRGRLEQATPMSMASV